MIRVEQSSRIWSREEWAAANWIGLGWVTMTPITAWSSLQLALPVATTYFSAELARRPTADLLTVRPGNRISRFGNRSLMKISARLFSLLFYHKVQAGRQNWSVEIRTLQFDGSSMQWIPSSVLPLFYFIFIWTVPFCLLGNIFNMLKVAVECRYVVFNCTYSCTFAT